MSRLALPLALLAALAALTALLALGAAALLPMMLVIALIWAAAWAILSGIGLLALRAFGVATHAPERLRWTFWIGWAATIGAMQLWHLGWQVDWRTAILVTGIGVTGLWVERGALTQSWRREQGLVAMIIAVLALLLANRALGPILHYDTGLYHLASVRWAATYPIIPGLGNLHQRFAYNSSHFLYVALFTNPWIEPRHLAHGLPILALLAQIVASIARLVRGERSVALTFDALLIVPVVLAATQYAANLAPDLPVLIVGALLAQILVRLLAGQGDARLQWVSLCALAALAVTLKLSMVVVAGMSLLVGCFAWWRQTRALPPLRVALLVGMLLTGPWVIRGVILSGYVGYPSTLVALPVDWRMPESLAQADANGIRSWARAPGVPPGPERELVLSSWVWFQSWLTRVSVMRWAFQIPVAALLLGAALVAWRRGAGIWPLGLVLVPFIANVIFWFWSAPDLRFLGSTLWVIIAALLTLALTGTGKRSALVCALAVALVTGLAIADSPAGIITIPATTTLGRTPKTDLEQFTTRTGLMVYRPVGKDQCWNAPLPCAPYPVDWLRLRRLGELDSGFTLK